MRISLFFALGMVSFTPELMETLYGVRAEFLQTVSGPVLAPCVEDW